MKPVGYMLIAAAAAVVGIVIGLGLGVIQLWLASH